MIPAHRRGLDPLGGSLVSAIAAGRIVLGASALLATDKALRALGFQPTDPGARALARLAGMRDVALGAIALWSRDDPEALRRAALIGAVTDAGDSLSFGLALARREGIDRAGLIGALSGAVGAVAGAWAASRLQA